MFLGNNIIFSRFLAYIISVILVILPTASIANPSASERSNWEYHETNTSISGTPSNLKYFKYYDVLPDDINLAIFKDMDVSQHGDKKLFVGYGTVDPSGESCRYFPDLGRTECFPWWRVEREYAIPETNATTISDFIKSLSVLQPPKNIQYCKEWKTEERVDGGYVTCTSFYDKRKSLSCLTEPEQDACKVNTCSDGIKQQCEFIGQEAGEITELVRPVLNNSQAPVGGNMIVGLKTMQYKCPAGYMPSKQCNIWEYGATYPFECKKATSADAGNGEYIYCDSNPLPVYNANQDLIGFTTTQKCSDGTAIDGTIGSAGEAKMCKVNSFSQTSKVCEDPIMESENLVAAAANVQNRKFKDYTTSVLFGDEAGDIYASDPLCLRLNTVEGARDQVFTTPVYGSGSLDDDIYVIAHKSNGTYQKIYCNMQHNEASSGSAKKWVATFGGWFLAGDKSVTATLTDNTGNVSTVTKTVKVVNSGGLNNAGVNLSAPGFVSIDRNTSVQFTVYSSSPVVNVNIDFGSSNINASLDSTTTSYVNKNYAGDILQCIDNDGSYSFNQNVTLSSSDIVSIQEASEHENATKEVMFARNHYGSTAVTIGGTEAAPATFPSGYPGYPANGPWLRTWDNALSTLGIMFPFAGAYEVFIFGGANESENRLLAQTTLTIDDFKDMPNKGYLQLKMGRSMALSGGMTEGNTSGACRDDDFTEWGGGVYGGAGSKNNMGGCASPNDSFSKSNSAYNILIKDLLTGAVTPIHLVYPLPYPNRIYISRLNVVENRKYRCYTPFVPETLGADCTINSVDESEPVSDYRGHSINLKQTTNIFCDTVNQKVIGCNKEKIIERSGGLAFANADSYESMDNSSMFMQALAGAQLSEQMMHIWSGWSGECEKGMFTDFSWTSDPLSLASLALSAYTSAMAGASTATNGAAEVGSTAVKTGASSEAIAIADAAGKTAAETGKPIADIISQLPSETLFATDASLETLTELGSGFTKMYNGMDTLGYALYGTVNGLTSGGVTAVSNAFTEMSTYAAQQVSKLTSLMPVSETLSGLQTLQDGYNTVATTLTTIYNETIDIGATLTSKSDELTSLSAQLGATTDTLEIASLSGEIELKYAEYLDLQNSLSGSLYSSSQVVSSSVSSLFTSPETSNAANLAAKNAEVQSLADKVSIQVKDFYNKVQEINKAFDVGYQTIKWTDIAQAGFSVYGNVKAEQDDMIKAWNAQKAYLLNGEGYDSDVSANAYASCMASLGASFVSTISMAAGATDTKATSDELLNPINHPLRISLKSLFELQKIVGQSFLEMSYLIKDVDYNMEMVTIVALNSMAYTQLTQIVCGGYSTAVATNALNATAGGSKPNMLDALANMSPQQMATMGLSVACALAGPWAFACGLALKILTSFKPGNACKDEEIAMSQKPIQLKTNKFIKTGQCHFINTSCSRKMLGSCVLKKSKYCCYDQIMTRIFAEGIKEQRGMGWGSCNDITINDLKDISFTPCSPGQNPINDKCFPADSYIELNNALKTQIKKGFAADGDTFMQQVQNSMQVAQ